MVRRNTLIFTVDNYVSSFFVARGISYTFTKSDPPLRRRILCLVDEGVIEAGSPVNCLAIRSSCSFHNGGCSQRLALPSA